MMLFWSIINSLKLYLFGKAFLFIDFLAFSKGVYKSSFRFLWAYILILPGVIYFAEIDLPFAARMFLNFSMSGLLRNNPQS